MRVLRLLPVLAAWTALASAADLVSVVVNATDSRAQFVVDGIAYRGVAHFSWVAGSKHMLEVRDPMQYISGNSSALVFQKFSDNKEALVPVGSTVQPITAAADVTSYTVEFYLYHRIDLWINEEPQINFFDGSKPNRVSSVDPCSFSNAPYVSPAGFIVTNVGVPCTRPGGELATQTLLAQFIPTSTWVWVQSGTTVQIDAYPYPGYVFLGWQMPSSSTTAYLQAITVTAPLTMHGVFAPARHYRFFSAPVAGLQLVIDRTAAPSRPASGYCRPDSTGSDPSVLPFRPGELVSLCDGEFDFAPGTQHLFAAPTSQTDSTGKVWVIDNWQIDSGQSGPQQMLWTVPEDWRVVDVTANFVKGVRTSLLTQPVGLKLKIDGRDNYVSYNFDWGVGHKHTISAPAEQADSKGRRYRFVSWSNGGTAEQTITVSDDGPTAGSLYLIANYELMGQLNVTSDPSALTFAVNGADCQTPCRVDAPAGTTIAVAAPPEVAYSADTHQAFSNWDDGTASPARSFTFTAGAVAWQARYNLLERLSLLTDPDGSATWQLDPAPGAGGFYKAGTRVAVTVKPNDGYKFLRFEGAITGVYETGTVNMNGPAAVLARLQKTPALKQNSVVNAASLKAEGGVAPGSLIAIEGYNLAAAEKTGPASPLAQTLDGVIVQLANRFLPLVSVAPETIVAALPSDLDPGEYTLTVRSPGQPVVSTKVTLSRNAPGLFRQAGATDEVPLALAFHADGSAVTVESPARAGETVSLLGTGFGPLNPRPLDGFAVPVRPQYTLEDPLTLLAGGSAWPTLWSGATAGRVGYDTLRFQVDPAMGQGANVEIRVSINGVVSNSVLLPVE